MIALNQHIRMISFFFLNIHYHKCYTTLKTATEKLKRRYFKSVTSQNLLAFPSNSSTFPQLVEDTRK